jgi:hypothetical protein
VLIFHFYFVSRTSHSVQSLQIGLAKLHI